MHILLMMLCLAMSNAFALVPVPPVLNATRTITQISANEFRVELVVQHSGINSYAKISERIPEGFDAFEEMSSNGIFSFRNSTVKYLYMTMPPAGELVIRYRLKAVRVPSGAYRIEGEMAFADDDHRMAKRKMNETGFSYDNVLAAAAAERDQKKMREMAYTAALRDGDQYYRENDFKGAIEQYKKALHIRPEKAELLNPKITEAQQRLDNLNALLEEDASALSLREREQAVQQKFEEYEREGDRLAQDKQYGAAIAQYQNALQVRPESEAIKVKMQQTRMQGEAMARAEQEAAQLEEDYAALMTEGDALLMKGDYDGALYVFSDATLLKPMEKLPRERMEYTRRKKAEEVAAAIEEKEKVTRQNEYAILLSEAALFYEQADYSNSLKLYEHAHRIHPDGEEAPKRIEEIRTILDQTPVSAADGSNEVMDSLGNTWDVGWERGPRTEEELLLLISRAAEDEDAEIERKRAHQERVENTEEVKVAQKLANGTMNEGLAKAGGPIKEAAVSYSDEQHLSAEEQARLADAEWERQHREELLQKKESLNESGQELTETGLVYRVQLASSTSRIPVENLKKQYNIDAPIVVRMVDGRYKYMAGYFKTYDEASAFKELVKTRGADGAFLVITYNGERITLQDARVLEAKAE